MSASRLRLESSWLVRSLGDLLVSCCIRYLYVRCGGGAEDTVETSMDSATKQAATANNIMNTMTMGMDCRFSINSTPIGIYIATRLVGWLVGWMVFGFWLA